MAISRFCLLTSERFPITPFQFFTEKKKKELVILQFGERHEPPSRILPPSIPPFGGYWFTECAHWPGPCRCRACPAPAQEALEEVCVCAGEGSGRDAAQEDRGRSGRRAEASWDALGPVTARWRADHPAEL